MKRKGFTLIELLAVIVVLAIIALIATPMVLNTIEEARKGASIESVNGIISAAETEYMSSMLTGKTTTRFDFSGDTNLDYKGTKPESGTLLVNDDGYGAQGIVLVERLLQKYGEVFVVAPKHHQSGKGQAADGSRRLQR